MREEKETDITSDLLMDSFINQVVESWRFCKVFEKVLSKLDAGEQNRYIGQYRWFLKKLDESLIRLGMKIVDIEGQRFDPGMAVTPLNLSEFDGKDILMIDQMLEPIIMNSKGLLRSGVVTLRRDTI